MTQLRKVLPERGKNVIAVKIDIKNGNDPWYSHIQNRERPNKFLSLVAMGKVTCSSAASRNGSSSSTFVHRDGECLFFCGCVAQTFALKNTEKIKCPLPPCLRQILRVPCNITARHSLRFGLVLEAGHQLFRTRSTFPYCLLRALSHPKVIKH